MSVGFLGFVSLCRRRLGTRGVVDVIETSHVKRSTQSRVMWETFIFFGGTWAFGLGPLLTSA